MQLVSNTAYRVVVVMAPRALDLSAYDGQVLAAIHPLQVPVIGAESIVPLGPLMPGNNQCIVKVLRSTT